MWWEVIKIQPSLRAAPTIRIKKPKGTSETSPEDCCQEAKDVFISMYEGTSNTGAPLHLRNKSCKEFREWLKKMWANAIEFGEVSGKMWIDTIEGTLEEWDKCCCKRAKEMWNSLNKEAERTDPFMPARNKRYENMDCLEFMKTLDAFAAKFPDDNEQLSYHAHLVLTDWTECAGR